MVKKAKSHYGSFNSKKARAVKNLITYVVAAALSCTAAHGQTIAWPTTTWPVTTPEAQGLDSVVLAEAFDLVRDKHIPIHSLLVVRNGAIVLDAYFFPFADHELHDFASVTKSVTSTLVGIAIGEKKLPGLDAPIVPLILGGGAPRADPRKSAIRIADLLSMTSGLDCHYDHGEITLTQMRQSPHWAQFMLDLPMVAQPGTTFEYCSGGMHVLSTAVTTATGKSELDFARFRLFEPLGISSAQWPSDPDGNSHGWGDLRLQPRDAAKIGYLWLHDGRWENQQIVPVDYVRAATTPHARAQWGEQYGYGLWVAPDKTLPYYEGNGRGGQRITVVPSKNLVIVTTGGGFEPADVDAFVAKALKSDSALPANPLGNARLAQALHAAAGSPPSQPATPLPPFASTFSGQEYQLEDNPIHLKSLSLSFKSASEASVKLTFADGHVEQDAIGLSGVPRLNAINPEGPVAVEGHWAPRGPIAIQGRWVTDGFDFDYDFVSGIDAFSFHLSPSGDGVILHIVQREQTGGLDITVHGALRL